MKVKTVVVLLFCIIPIISPAQESVIKLELEFGDENLPDEYLLVKPQWLNVSENGDVFVVDEKRVKIYDTAGNAKMIVGGSGLGPGEFVDPLCPYIGKTGYLTVTDCYFGPAFHVFDPDYKFYKNIFIKYYNFFEHVEEYLISGPGNFPLVEVLAINKDKYIGHFATKSRDRFQQGKRLIINYFQYEVLALINGDKITEITRYDHVPVSKMNQFIHFMEPLQWGISDSKVIYSYPSIDKTEENEKTEYTIHCFDLTNNKQSKIIHQYTPVRIRDSDLQEFRDLEEMIKRIDPRYWEDMWTVLNGISHYDSFKRLYVDDNKIMVFTYSMNKSGYYLVNVFDAISEKFMHAIYSPVIPDCIKNGYAYKVGESDGFPVIQKYRIDPSVYGK
ncbi:hypothetical protein ACFL7D_04840 [candidate division KSB1 bacterium]